MIDTVQLMKNVRREIDTMNVIFDLLNKINDDDNIHFASQMNQYLDQLREREDDGYALIDECQAQISMLIISFYY